MKDIVVLAGTTPWSVLSLCKVAYKKQVRAFVICIDNNYADNYKQSKFVYCSIKVKYSDLKVLWHTFFNQYSFKSKPILYTTTDYSCEIVDEDREFYEENFELCTPSSKILESFLDKPKSELVAKENGLVVPKSLAIETKKDIQYIIDNFIFPVIVKPINALEHNRLGFKVKIIEKKDDLLSFLKDIFLRNGKLICQEYIQGNDSDYKFYIFYRDKDGNIQECMGEKTLQSNGIMTIGTTKYDDTLSKISRDFLNKIDYVGIGGIEYKKYKDEYYFIEMSVRTEGFLPISDIAGVSLAEASYNSIDYGYFTKVKQQENVKYIVFFSWTLDRLKNKQFGLYLKEFILYTFDRKTIYIGTYIDKFFIVKNYIRMLKKKLHK